MEVLQVAKVGVAGYDVVRLGFQGAGQKHVIRGIFRYLAQAVTARREQGFFQDQTDKLVDVLRGGLEPGKDAGIMEHPVELGQDRLGSNQDKGLLSDQIPKLPSANYFAPGILGEIKVPILSGYSIINDLVSVLSRKERSQWDGIMEKLRRRITTTNVINEVTLPPP